MKIYWKKSHETYQGVFFSLFCFFSIFSISLSQIFSALAFLIWIIDIFFSYKYLAKKKRLKKYFLSGLNKIKNFNIIYFIFAWVIYRFFHVIISSNMPIEFQINKELIVILMLPLVVFSIKKEKWIKIGLFSLFFSGFITSFFNVYMFYLSDVSLFNPYFRAAAFNNVNPLTYTGTMAFTLFLSMGVSLYYFSRKNNYTIIAILFSFFSFIGFILSNSKGGIIALIFTTFFTFLIIYQKRVIILFPIFLLLFAYSIRYISTINNFVINEIIYDKKKYWLSTALRTNIWQTGFKIWLDNSLIGTGEANYMNLYHKYKDKKLWQKGIAYKGSHMHNDFLDVLVRFGSIGFSIFIMFYLAPLITFFRRMDDILKSDNKWIMVFSIASVVMMALMGMTQCHFRDDEVQILFWLTVGLFYRYLIKLDDGFEKRKIESRQD